MSKLFSTSPFGQEYGISIIRMVTGILLIWHGWETFDAEKMKMYAGWFTDRHYNSPAAWAYAGKIAELLAGIGFALGLFTRLASVAAIAAFAGIISCWARREKFLKETSILFYSYCSPLFSFLPDLGD